MRGTLPSHLHLLTPTDINSRPDWISIRNLKCEGIQAPHGRVVTVLGSVTTFMWEENGSRLVTEKLTPGKMTIFPQGSMHMMVNTGETTSDAILSDAEGIDCE